MGPVTIDVEDAALNAAKRAAGCEKQHQTQNWSAFFAEIDRFKPEQEDEFPSHEQIRASQEPDMPREYSK